MAGAALKASGMVLSVAAIAAAVMAAASTAEGRVARAWSHIRRTLRWAGQAARDRKRTAERVSMMLQIASARPVSSARPGVGPMGRPTVRETYHRATNAALPMAMARASLRVGLEATSTARTIWAQPTARKKTPKGRYSRKCAGATAKSMKAAPSVSIAAVMSRKPPKVPRLFGIAAGREDRMGCV